MSTFIFEGEVLRLVTAAYGNGGLAVQIVTNNGVPFATLSVRMPQDDLPPDVFRLKTWSENTDIAAAVIAAGLVTRVEGIAPAASGYVAAHAYRLAAGS